MAVPGYVLKNRRTTLERAEKFISSECFTDVNLYGRIYSKKTSLKSISHYAAPDRVSFESAVKAPYTSAKIGDKFGPTWSTHWFCLEIEVPKEWEGEEVCLLWDSNSEAAVWKDGEMLQGLTPENKRTQFFLSHKLADHDVKQVLYVEMACNGRFGAGQGSLIGPPKLNAEFTLKQAELAVRDHHVYQLYVDIEVLVNFIQNLDEDDNRSMQALYTLNDMVNIASQHNSAAYHEAHEMALQFFSVKNGASQHVIHASGHCHIDTAWLWPYAETVRKCGRSWSSTIRLMEQYPDLTFCCSQAQQFQWVQDHYPGLFDKIKRHVKLGQFIPVGGTWVEMDGNIPSGEAFVRQFYYGQKYFEKVFGVKCNEFWLPDTFGYSGNLPQLMKLAGITRFLTQKMSWNLVNKFPHHTFWWEGIDGSSILTHFPPGDCYGMEAKPQELLYTLKNFKDKGRSNSSMFLFGWGDGGQGPTADMIERLHRLEDMDGCPKVVMSTPDEFFSYVDDHDSHKLCHWRGELYLEMHNATFTTQANVKKRNRKCELSLQEAEIVCSMAYILHRAVYPTQELDRLWKLLLLNQFHDVLPGTSIHSVYKDVADYYKDIEKNSGALFDSAVSNIFKEITDSTETETEIAVFNQVSWQRNEVVELPSQVVPPCKKTRTDSQPVTQIDANGNTLVYIGGKSLGFTAFSPAETIDIPVSATKGPQDHIFLTNKYLKVELDTHGRLVSLTVEGCNRNTVAADELGNQFVLFDDIPLYWDAWDVMDYHLQTRMPIDDILEHARIIEDGPLRASVQVMLKISDHSYLKQKIMLDYDSVYLKFETEVSWHEAHKFLKVEFPVSVHSTQATYEIQFGHLQRPNHFNTSWEWAKYEVCGHKWADLSEYNFGVAILNDCKYGWSCISNVIRLSLLRSSKAPDEKADMGSHKFTYAVMPHTRSLQEAGVIQAAYNLNCPLRLVQSPCPLPDHKSFSCVDIDNPAIVCETVKLADHGQVSESLPVVLRFYEAFGSHVEANIHIKLPLESPQICNILEEVVEEEVKFEEGVLTLSFNPFQVISVMFQIKPVP